MINPEKIAVIIIGRNEGERLNRAIQSAKSVGVKTVYVDSASTDQSVKNAKENDIPVIELSQNKPLSAARARNAGFRWISEHMPGVSYIHLLDGDCLLDKDWLSVAVEELEKDEKLAVVTGRLRERNWRNSIYGRLSDMGWYITPGEIMSAGGIATMKARVFKKVGGFDETLIAGEEPEFYQRIRKMGYKLRCLENDIGTHDSNISSYAEWWTRTIRTGFSYANASEWGRWKKERRSLVIWGGVLPALVICSMVYSTLISILLAFLYPVQVFRIFSKLSIPYDKEDRILFSFFCVMDKFPEFLGFLKYHYAKISGKKQNIIEYKNKDDVN